MNRAVTLFETLARDPVFSEMSEGERRVLALIGASDGPAEVGDMISFLNIHAACRADHCHRLRRR